MSGQERPDFEKPDFERIARALSDPKRCTILGAVAQGDGVMCGDVYPELNVSPATMSHHIRELEQAGLITTVKEGRCIRLVYRSETMRAYLGQMSRMFNMPLETSGETII